MRSPVLSPKSAALRVSRLVPVITLFALLFLGQSLRAENTWTGASGTNWATPGNWSTAAVPVATDTVVIPDTDNKPVILGGTSAVAKTVVVQSGGLLTVNAMGILTIEGASGFNTGGMLNQGTVTINAGGLLRIGLTVSPGQYGLVNEGTFNNAGEISIDRTDFSGMGLWNKAGSTFTNTGKVTIGGGVGTNGVSLYNEAVFQNIGGELNIDRFNSAAIHNLAGSSLTNTGKIAIGKTAAGGGAGIYNFATFNNNMGAELSIDRANAGIDNRQHSSFINAGKITIGGVASLNGPGVYNASDFQNNGGEISIDRTYAGITNYDSSTVTNSGKITIGTKGKLPFNPGIYNYSFIPVPPYYSPNFPVFNNNAGGEIIIDSTSNQAALHHQSGIFTNSGKITIGVTLSINGPGLYNQAVFNNNSDGEIYIDGVTNTGFGSALGNNSNYNTTASFTNAGKIVIGAAFEAGNSGVYNGYNSIFTNNAGAEISIDRIRIQTYEFNNNTYSYSGNGLHNSYTFINSGKITIGSAVNGGSHGLFHYSGVFTNNSGAEISIDHILDSGSNNNGLYSNSTFTNSGKITIGSAVSGGIHGLFNANVFSNNSGAEISIDHVSNNDMYGNSHGLFNTNTFTNAGKITIGSTASAGHNGLYNASTFNNNAGAEITIDHVMDTLTPLNTHGLRNDNNFTNAGKITIGGTAAAGQWGLWNASTFNNNATGEINISRSDTCGLRNGSYNDGSNFINAGKITVGAAGSAGNYGIFNSSTFSNSTCSARIEVISDNIIVAPGTFSNAGTIVENAGGNSNITSNTGIVQNLNGGVFSIGSGNAPITFPGYLSACGAIISGVILWENDGTSGVKNASVKLTGDTTATALTPLSGAYAFTVSTGSNFTITTTKNINKLNGLNVADVTAIQQHVANIALLPAPFKRIAADVNKSNSINTLDASLINQVLLGNPQANAIFNTSWRFVPTSYSFLNPNVPWGFPEKITLTGASGLVNNQDFYGIKLGDVVSTWANPANFGKGEPLVFRVPNRVLQAGEEVTAEFRADQLDDLNAFQFALRFDLEQVELVKIDIEASGGLPLSTNNFGTYNIANGEIRVVWSQTTSVQLSEATPIFRLRFKALESGARLSEVLQLNQEALPGYVYNSAYAESGVELRYTESTGTNPGGILPDLTLDNRPNPFTDVTTLRFVLPQAGAAELRVYDVSGRLLFSQKKTYTAGQQMETLRLEGVSGVLFAELVTEQGSVLRKMLAVK